MRKYPEQKLPCCGYIVDSHSDQIDSDGRVEPRKGDFSVCIHCACILIFTDDNGTVRLANDNDPISYEIAIGLAKAVFHVMKHNRMKEHMNKRRN